jgi:hypothetical protein
MQSPKEDEIAEIGIDQAGRLYVQPAKQTFPYVYRAAMEVHWDQARGVLFSPKPREWSYRQWFRQILDAVTDEYGVHLRIGVGTTWTNVPDLLRTQIEADRHGA